MFNTGFTMVSRGYARSMAERDKKISALESRVSLAQCAQNKTEVTRLERQLKQLRQSL
jgi:hypothetical protein